MHTINLSGFKFIGSDLWMLWKAYQEGLYSDTPANRKLGRVGMTYLDYERHSKTLKEQTIKEIKERAELERLSKLVPPKPMPEAQRKEKFSEFGKDDVIYLSDNYKAEEGNYTISDIKRASPTSNLLVVHLKGENGKEVSFLKDYLIGSGEFKDFQIQDLNYSLQEKPSDFTTKKEAIANFEKEINKFTSKLGLQKDEKVSDDFLKEDIKIALGSVQDFKGKTKNISLDPWGVTVEVSQNGKNEIYSIEALDNKKYKVTHFSKNEQNKSKLESHSMGDNLTGSELKNLVNGIYKDAK